MVTIRPLVPQDVTVIEELAGEAEAEGFRFVTRFVAELRSARIACDTPREFFLGAFDLHGLLGFGGVTPDPYVADPTTGRLRHLYVLATARRRGVGRLLVHALEERAARAYRRLRLRTDTTVGAQFYERLGYERTDDAHATHTRRLSRIAEAAT